MYTPLSSMRLRRDWSTLWHAALHQSSRRDACHTHHCKSSEHKHDIMRHVKFYVFHLNQCDIPTLMSPLSAILQLNVTFFRIGSTCNKSFNSYNKPSSSPLLDGEISSSNLSSNPNVPLDLGTLTKRPLKGHQNIFID